MADEPKKSWIDAHSYPLYIPAKEQADEPKKSWIDAHSYPLYIPAKEQADEPKKPHFLGTPQIFEYKTTEASWAEFTQNFKQESPPANEQAVVSTSFASIPFLLPANFGKEPDVSVAIGDIERRSGLLVLGKSGMGKSSLMVNLALEDVTKGHGLFFLDPHAEAIDNLLKRGDQDELLKRAILLDPEDETRSFGINLLTCRNPTSLKARSDTLAHAYNVFKTLFQGETGEMSVWLDLIIQYALPVLIEVQDYTLAELPRFLEDATFRNSLLPRVSDTLVVDFWRRLFQFKQAEAAITRVSLLLSHPYVRHVIGQRVTTVDFHDIMEERKILLIKFSSNMAGDVKRFLGTILLNELLFAVRSRKNRHQFSIYIDELATFASSQDIATLTTEGRKFGIATTFASVNLAGQLADNPKLKAAALSTANKVCFQLMVDDAEYFGKDFASQPPVEYRKEPEYTIHPNPLDHMMLHGHRNGDISYFTMKYLKKLAFRRKGLEAESTNQQLLRIGYQAQAMNWQAEFKEADHLLHNRPTAFWGTRIIQMPAPYGTGDRWLKAQRGRADAQRSVAVAVDEIRHIQAKVSAIDVIFENLNRLIYRIMISLHFKETEETRKLFSTTLEAKWLQHSGCTVEEFTRFLGQFALPENRIEVASGQYVLVPYYPKKQSDMADEMVNELVNLPRYSAYFKYAATENGRQVVKKERLQTQPLPEVQDGEAYQSATVQGGFYSKLRTEIEEEISARREWRKSNTMPSRPPPKIDKPPTPPKPANAEPLDSPPPFFPLSH